jgi:thioredoxin-like negative regulator of GroEL
MRIDKSPKNADYHLGLAQVYFTMGDKEKTIAELQAIIAIDPNQAGQIGPLITQIQDGTLKP